MRASSTLLCCVFFSSLLLSAVRAATVESGTSSSSVGKDIVVNTPPKSDTAPLGRRAGPQADQAQLRQATVPPVGINDPTLLPDCRPGNGVICSDRDYTKVLAVQPANIDLAPDNFAYVGLNPAVEGSLGIDTKADLGQRSFSTAAKAIGLGEVKSNVGTEVLNAASQTASTVAGLALKNNRFELAVPEKLTVTLGKTDSENSIERRTNKPNFYYVFGQNFGLPVGLALAKDGVSGKH